MGDGRRTARKAAHRARPRPTGCRRRSRPRSAPGSCKPACPGPAPALCVLRLLRHRSLKRLGDAGVDDLRPAAAVALGDQDIRGLEVAMNDAPGVRMLHRVDEPEKQADPIVQAETLRFSVPRDALAVRQFHDEAGTLLAQSGIDDLRSATDQRSRLRSRRTSLLWARPSALPRGRRADAGDARGARRRCPPVPGAAVPPRPADDPRAQGIATAHAHDQRSPRLTLPERSLVQFIECARPCISAPDEEVRRPPVM